jgi:hypothetical protein
MTRPLVPTAALAACALLAAACGETVDPAGLPSIDGYRSWPMIERTNPIGGHGDSVRRIYANDVALAYPHSGPYRNGTVIVKEIFEDAGDDTAGDLSYVAIMRKVGDDADVDAPVDGGWIFTQLKDGEEKSLDSCWATCHRQGPWDGAFLDYGALDE